MGIKRQVDRCGRISIPVEFRKEINLNFEDYAEIEMIDNKIVISKVDDVKEELKDVLISMLDSLKENTTKEAIQDIIDIVNCNL